MPAGLLSIGGYAALFLAMLIEGPVAAAAGAFAASAGYLNVYGVFILAILGNVIPDIVYFSIGHFGGKQAAEKYGHKFGLSAERLRKLQTLSTKHLGKALLIIKLTPFIPPAGIVAISSSGIKFRDFILRTPFIDVPISLFFILLGYYGGATYINLSKKVNGEVVLIPAILIVFVIFSLAYKKLAKEFANRQEKFLS